MYERLTQHKFRRPIFVDRLSWQMLHRESETGPPLPLVSSLIPNFFFEHYHENNVWNRQIFIAEKTTDDFVMNWSDEKIVSIGNFLWISCKIRWKFTWESVSSSSYRTCTLSTENWILSTILLIMEVKTLILCSPGTVSFRRSTTV